MRVLIAVSMVLVAGTSWTAHGQAPMSFFVTSAGTLSKGADLGGLDGADRMCQSLAQAAGAGGKTWHAYLSTQAAGTAPAVNARVRIGPGPWQNATGTEIAKDVAELHGQNKLTKATALTEKGERVNGRGDAVNEHDILTGSQPDGTAFPPGEDNTCGNWTKSGAEGRAMLGHSDRTGLDDSAAAHSWNASHPSRGCSQEALKGTGGSGRLYCFAVQ